MKQNIIHIGLDVDDTQYHGAAFNKDTGEVIDFKSRPTLKGLLQQLDRMAEYRTDKSYFFTNPQLLSKLFSSHLCSSFQNFTGFCYPQQNES